jgi:heterotetrameric sarcosine oxidase alpha subunit
MIRGLRRGARLSEQSFEFSFYGRQLSAQQGDTLASALLANGQRLVGRSFKYRRPRGLLTAGVEEPNGLVTVGSGAFRVPNVPSPRLRLAAGMIITSQNRWPSLQFDLASSLQLVKGFLGAGFYYKTFMWPSWRFYEPLIRRLAGLGPAPADCNLAPPEVRNLDCDVLIAGGGPAGLAAALAAVRSSARVVLCERDSTCGGELEFETATIDGESATAWIAAALAEIQRSGGLVLNSTAVVGGTNGLVVAIQQPGGLPGADTLYRIRPRSFIAAMGCVERPLAFIDNDRPGVMLVNAAESYLAAWGVQVGQEAILFGNHDRLYAAAQRLAAGGVRIRAVIDVRSPSSAPTSEEIRRALAGAGIECLMGHAVVRALGGSEVRGVQVASLDARAPLRTIACDALLISGGWSPATHAGLNEGGTSTYLPQVTGFGAGPQPGWRALCGAANGIFELGEVLADGHRAGVNAARSLGLSTDSARAPIGQGDSPPHLVAYWRALAKPSDENRQFVDFQNDVTVADLRQSLEEGFTDIEHVKRYTTLGVGTDQGRIGAVLGAAILAELSAREVGEVGQFRARPPYQPVTMKTIAGLRAGLQLRPVRRTPLEAWHASHGGMLEPMGLWMRARYYDTGGVDAARAGCDEATRVRAYGGIFDGSTLGKFEVVGRDAAEFLDRMYLTRASTIKVGRSKYMVNLREDGMVLDDGIALRLATDRFLVTTSTGHADHMLSHFEYYRDTDYAGRAVSITDVSEAWAVIVCAGPAARQALGAVLGEGWIEPLSRLTHMGFATGEWRGAALRLLRASFSGELAFELHCRPRIAIPLWQALVDSGLPPYGIEALDILRLEKGYLIGAELNGQTTPADLGMDALVKAGNPCIGRELMDRAGMQRADRPKLVGVRAVDGRSKFLAGAQLTTPDEQVRSSGYVTSSAYSPSCREWIGLALLSRQNAHEGNVLLARDPLRAAETLVRVTSPVHFDPTGERMKS